MTSQQIGLIIIALGIILVIAGVIAWLGGLDWFGRLPGDIRIEGERTRVYIPIATMIILSVLLTLILYLVRRLF